MENDDIEQRIFYQLELAVVNSMDNFVDYDIRSHIRFAMWSNSINTLQDTIWSSIWESVGDIITKEK